MWLRKLTLMFGSFHQLTDHSLNDPNVSIECATQSSTHEGDPKVRSQAHQEQRDHGAETAGEEDGFATQSVRKAAPEHPGHGFGEGERGDENSGVEGGIVAASHVEILDHHP